MEEGFFFQVRRSDDDSVNAERLREKPAFPLVVQKWLVVTHPGTCTCHSKKKQTSKTNISRRPSHHLVARFFFLGLSVQFRSEHLDWVKMV